MYSPAIQVIQCSTVLHQYYVQEYVDLCIHSPICLHDIVLKQLSIGTTFLPSSVALSFRQNSIIMEQKITSDLYIRPADYTLQKMTNKKQEKKIFS